MEDLSQINFALLQLVHTQGINSIKFNLIIWLNRVRILKHIILEKSQ